MREPSIFKQIADILAVLPGNTSAVARTSSVELTSAPEVGDVIFTEGVARRTLNGRVAQVDRFPAVSITNTSRLCDPTFS